jgi:hypothetical protein
VTTITSWFRALEAVQRNSDQDRHIAGPGIFLTVLSSCAHQAAIMKL